MNTTIDTSMFWDIGRTLTYNKLVHFILGNRGGGKTYGAKQKGIDNFIKRKEQFGYIRRYKEDLKKPMEQYFKDIAAAYPDHEFKVEGEKFYIRLKPADEKEKWTENDVAGYGFVLSTANNKKSVSYPNITMLIFDEFLLEKGTQHYLPNEPEKLLNLYETVARPGTGHPRVTLFLLANAISITNPYFLYWDLKMPKKQDKNGKWVWTHPHKPILVEDVRNEKFIDAKRNTEFGQLVEGTTYADYSIENKFLLDDDTFIQRKTPNARYYFTFIYKGRSFGVWVDGDTCNIYVSKAVDPSFPFCYSVTLADHRPNTLLIKNRRNSRFNLLIENYKQGNVYFEDMTVKNMCYEVIKTVMNY